MAVDKYKYQLIVKTKVNALFVNNTPNDMIYITASMTIKNSWDFYVYTNVRSTLLTKNVITFLCRILKLEAYSWLQY